jgi:hypothetical protein
MKTKGLQNQHFAITQKNIKTNDLSVLAFAGGWLVTGTPRIANPCERQGGEGRRLESHDRLHGFDQQEMEVKRLAGLASYDRLRGGSSAPSVFIGCAPRIRTSYVLPL